MRAEQILSVLMDDKKYKARIEEMQALDKRLSLSQQIAATVEEAQTIFKQAEQKKLEVAQYEQELSALFEKKMKELKEQAREQALVVEERGVRERAQYMEARDWREQGVVALEQAHKVQDQIVNERKELKEWEEDLHKREDMLAKKVERLNKAWSN